jgi:hypothetical protein
MVVPFPITGIVPSGRRTRLVPFSAISYPSQDLMLRFTRTFESDESQPPGVPAPQTED